MKVKRRHICDAGEMRYHVTQMSMSMGAAKADESDIGCWVNEAVAMAGVSKVF